jgi:hypothetical protein
VSFVCVKFGKVTITKQHVIILHDTAYEAVVLGTKLTCTLVGGENVIGVQLSDANNTTLLTLYSRLKEAKKVSNGCAIIKCRTHQCVNVGGKLGTGPLSAFPPT